MKYILKRFRLTTIFKVAAIVGLVYGLISGIISIVFWTVARPFTTIFQSDPSFYGSLVLNGIIVNPIFSAIYMAIAAAIVCGLYNFFSKRIGGIEINLNSGLVTKKY
ncbi:MAG: hypothetical protein AMQ22_01125 [Candidatus Methanofastidiosum methylothiophilum]|uniref:DUF3566 domain-containing protein n=1 Tax=Candidatus Methanofastidiosum methylothiophilum TaxID=1705564 RepID=A0A150J3R2_9EURY|nr:MAG: hypothetical protein AMQ22_01125 [Candidatus Methanofastidiosum methylthiophilus]